MPESAEQVRQTVDQDYQQKDTAKSLRYSPKFKLRELKDHLDGNYPTPVAIVA